MTTEEQTAGVSWRWRGIPRPRLGTAVDDLFTFITPHLATAQNPNDVHFNAKGYDLLGGQVAESILGSLKKAQP